MIPSTAEPLAAPPSKAESFFLTAWQSETDYAVWAISDEIARMCYFAARKSVPAGLVVAVQAKDKNPDHPVYSVNVKYGDGIRPIQKDLIIKDALWSEESYVPLATALLAACGHKNAERAARADSLLLAIDLQNNFTAAELQKQNDLLSKALSRDFTNDQLHDEAAVLIGAFRFREYCDYFSDVRPSLNRSTAHLAMADALRGARIAPGTNHQLGRALNELGMNRQVSAWKSVEVLPASLAPWKTAIEVKSTGDWRRWAEVAKRTRLENLAFFHAKVIAVSHEVALENMKAAGLDDGADWKRILNLAEPPVAIGHGLLESALSSEWTELSNTHNLYFGEPLSKDKPLEALNVLPGHCLTSGNKGQVDVRVLDWGIWADFFQRHLSEAIYMNYDFIMLRWGNPDAGPKYLESVKLLTSGLRLGPLLRKMVSFDNQSYHAAMRDSYQILRNSPQTVPVRTWNMICYSPLFKEDREFPDNVLPHINEWHEMNPPPGTAINIESRLDHPSLTGRPDFPEKMAELRAMAPTDEGLAFAKNKMTSSLSEAERFRAAYAPLLPWSPTIQVTLANLLGADNPQSSELMESAAKIDPGLHFIYAQFLVASGKKEQAALEFEKGIEQATDAVAAANNSYWLVMYYADQGRLDEARKLADSAAEVYSYSGLETKAALMERLGDNETAEANYKKILERYGAEGPLAGFRIRVLVKTGDKEKIAQATGRVFRNGMQNVSLTNLPFSEPERGVAIYETSPSLTKAGLRPRDVIVALDGIRVESFAQYDFVRAMNRDPEMKLIVWQDGKYREVAASPPNKKFGVGMGNYVR